MMIYWTLQATALVGAFFLAMASNNLGAPVLFALQLVPVTIIRYTIMARLAR
jgi:hypothetical protein